MGAPLPPVAEALPRAALSAEVEALPASQQLVDAGRLRVYLARAAQIPSVLEEIGRLREMSFRAAGEGTGKAADLDVFDAHYRHLFVWDAAAAEVIGAYRLGLVDEILARHGARGLYTASLFDYGARALERLDPGIELGRSFVRPECQRSFAPLLLLWRGIGRFVADAPRYALLFGPVSISNRYAPASRRLMVAYLSTHRAEPRLARDVTPRHPFREPTSADAASVRSVEDLSHRVSCLEHDRKGLPVLLRQYLRLGGRVLGFSLDRNFADSLDGLLLVDLRATAPELLARYMGRSASGAFRAYHAEKGVRAIFR